MLILISVLFSSCNTAALYTTDQCTIRISVSEGYPTASSVLVNLLPADSKAYYFSGIVESDIFYNHVNDLRFMQMCLDYEYKEYIIWRYDLLEKEEEFIADFSSHCLSYGEDTKFFRELKPETEYVVFAFCVNPENNQPIGNLYRVNIATGELRESDLTFEVMFKEREDGTYVSIMPSNDDDSYLWEWDDKAFLDENKLTLKQYMEAVIKSWQEYGMAEYMYSKGPETYKCVEGDLTPGHKYVMIATGYDGTFTTKIYHLEFEYPFLTEDPIPLEE